MWGGYDTVEELIVVGEVMQKFLSILFCVMLCSGCAMFDPNDYTEVDVAQLGTSEIKQQLRVGVKVRVSVSASGFPVFEEQLLEVSASGDIVLPYIQSVQCAGMTIEEFRAEVAKRYEEFYREPIVTAYYVPLAEGGSSPYGSVLVTGSVARPGVVPIPPTCDLTVMQALQLAGGVGMWASKEVRLTREVNGVRQSVVLDTERIGRQGASELNVLMMPGDILDVPESNW